MLYVYVDFLIRKKNFIIGKRKYTISNRKIIYYGVLIR